MPTHYQGSPAEVRALDLIIKLVRCTDSVNHRLEVPLADTGLTTSQFGVLEALWHLGPLCLSELAKKLLKTGGNLTLVVRNLERDGLVKRQRQKDDHRYQVVRLTPKGERLIQKVFPLHLARLVKLVNGLQAAEQEQLAELCKRLGKGA
jgi:MarR family transcriptional regulator, 2-MHQ and catechol-resistance regulon repressor